MGKSGCRPAAAVNYSPISRSRLLTDYLSIEAFSLALSNKWRARHRLITRAIDMFDRFISAWPNWISWIASTGWIIPWRCRRRSSSHRRHRPIRTVARHLQSASVNFPSFFLFLRLPLPPPPPPKKKENLTLNQSNHSRLPVSHRSTQPMNFIQFQFNSNVELNNQSQLRWQLAQSNGEWGGGKLAKMSLIGRLSGRTAAEIMAAWVAATPATPPTPPTPPPIISPQLARECHWIKWIMALIGQSMGNGTGSAPLDTYRQIRTVCTHPSSQCHKSTRCNITIGQIKHSECGW